MDEQRLPEFIHVSDNAYRHCSTCHYCREIPKKGNHTIRHWKHETSCLKWQFSFEELDGKVAEVGRRCKEWTRYDPGKWPWEDRIS
jgi:hypothetical protein